MSKHVAILGFIWTILGGLSVVGGLLFVLFGLGSGLLAWAGAEDGAAAGGVLALFGSAVGGMIIGGGLLSVLTGLGILGRRGWGRVLGVIGSVLNLVSLSWMSLLGIYGLWVLLSEAGGREFKKGRAR